MANARFVTPVVLRTFAVREDRAVLAEAITKKRQASATAKKERIRGKKYRRGEKPETWGVINAAILDRAWEAGPQAHTCRVCKKVVEDRRDAIVRAWGISHLLCDIRRSDQIKKVYAARREAAQARKDDAWRRERGLIP